MEEPLGASLRESGCMRIENDAGGFVRSARRGGGVGGIWEGGEPKPYSGSSSMMAGTGDRGGEFDGARLGRCGTIRGMCIEEVGVGRRNGVQRIGYKSLRTRLQRADGGSKHGEVGVTSKLCEKA